MQHQQPHPPPPVTVNRSVFFSGIPLNVERERLRQLFESVGHVVDLRLFNPTPGKSVRHGLVEYMDERSAAEAMSRLNGSMLGDRPMRVVAAQPPRNDRKRQRDEHEMPTGPMGAMYMHGVADGGGGVRRSDVHMRGALATTAHAMRAADGARGVLRFSADVVDPLLGRADTSVLDCLSGMSVDEAYEAVEQLRVLAQERPHDAGLLLRDNPVLRSAVVLILQHAGRLPYGNLPPQAYRREGEGSGGGGGGNDGDSEGDRGGATEAMTTAAAAGAETSTNASAVTATATTEAQRDEVLQLIRCMSEADVERVLRMSDADLAAVANVQQRQQLSVLRRRLLDMSRTL